MVGLRLFLPQTWTGDKARSSGLPSTRRASRRLERTQHSCAAKTANCQTLVSLTNRLRNGASHAESSSPQSTIPPLRKSEREASPPPGYQTPIPPK
jgi:hypothetical protein